MFWTESARLHSSAWRRTDSTRSAPRALQFGRDDSNSPPIRLRRRLGQALYIHLPWEPRAQQRTCETEAGAWLTPPYPMLDTLSARAILLSCRRNCTKGILNACAAFSSRPERVGEAPALKWNDINGNVATFRITRSGISRSAPSTHPAAEALERARASSGHGPFPANSCPNFNQNWNRAQTGQLH